MVGWVSLAVERISGDAQSRFPPLDPAFVLASAWLPARRHKKGSRSGGPRAAAVGMTEGGVGGRKETVRRCRCSPEEAAHGRCS